MVLPATAAAPLGPRWRGYRDEHDEAATNGVADGPAAALGSRRLWQRGRHHHATPITLYTCVNDTTIQPVIQKFEAAHAGAKVDLFRAPTGQLKARVASDVRSGGLKADVIWACDPLTMQDYVVRAWLGAGWGYRGAARYGTAGLSAVRQARGL
jgi:ABC-type glycerol-3-phosphate transport system substrate-binding protein